MFLSKVKKTNLSGKIVDIFLPINFNIYLGAQKKRLIETLLLSTHNICNGREIRKLNFRYALLSKVLIICMFYNILYVKI